MGNICRSPTAEGVFRKVVNDQNSELDIKIDSAGTHAYHVGDSPDPRSCAAALERGIDISHQRARRINKEDFSTFDLILAMDQLNYETLINLCPSQHQKKVKLLMDFVNHAQLKEVPDPYFGNGDGFERVLDLVEKASIGLLNYLLETTLYDNSSKE
tara:strand:- start:187 stop:657 length:471 start_codon:yes stop_codon:yes gene_type:complete